MRFIQMNATFGVLQQHTLDFAPGLNIIEAPNESGKSTLAAFLRAMLYGLPTRDRGMLADKNRFQPWSGVPMRGTLTLESERFGAVTLTRETSRSDAPMGRFSATYTGSGNTVAALTAADCGEALLGVPREVYERSAFIRQGGLTIESNAELERRIEALITTGEERVSYSEAMSALKKQLNARRLNVRSGLIPSLEREIDAISNTLQKLRTLQEEHEIAKRAIDSLQQQETLLRKALHTHEIANMQKLYAAREYARRSVETAEKRERQFRAMLTEAHIPPLETLVERRRQLDMADDLMRQQAEAGQIQREAEATLYALRSKKKPSLLGGTGILWLTLLLVCVTFFAAVSIWPSFSRILRWSGVAALVFALPLALAVRRGLSRRRECKREIAAAVDAIRDAEEVCTTLKFCCEQTMKQASADISANDTMDIHTFIRENLERYDMLSQLERDACAKREHYESYPTVVLKNIPAYPVTRPSESPETLRAELERITEERNVEQRRADVTAGQIAAIGDIPESESMLNGKREQLATAQDEYDAIALAIDALEKANVTIQNRFSPELGRRAAVYFSTLTGGKYDTVALNRAFHAMASQSDDRVLRDSALLSQGTGEQLYFAVRLAICDMVLPTDQHAPLVLDDALVSFDDTRCAAALEVLAQIAQKRQILLLTCQHREAIYLSGREDVRILSL